MEFEELKTASARAQEGQRTDSVFDFLYYDTARISSFLSQFDAFGHLTEITHREHANRNKSTVVANKLDGNTLLVKGSISSETDAASEYGQDSQRTYDPRWANALNFLDYLDENRLLQRDISVARIGQFVLASGSLAAFDMGLLRGMWSLPSIKRAMNQGVKVQDGIGNRHSRRKDAVTKPAGQTGAEQSIELATDLLSVLPHSIQSSITHDNMSVWASLKEECLTVSPVDLFMKHGMTIAGTWSFVGILDARPEDENFLSELASQTIAGTTLGGLGGMLVPHLVPAIRPLLGRPATSFGITPLLLFRQVGPDSE
ncbi:hypothetical protein DUT91_24730 [Phyllobacterium salinisoli]|uniref:Uncharacterized protein n=1 Tax=Phyllobacterium salinisoli TaxID=1899321 RepID=A0A368JWL2_9HYPH|nr:hypothetical protein [Phyllobacterium salinisoli]RCS21351.1 hypothetical protein DUT91_24730 [Phyllobacterium salinisoli]